MQHLHCDVHIYFCSLAWDDYDDDNEEDMGSNYDDTGSLPYD